MFIFGTFTRCLRLPRPEVDIPEGCNFGISAVLMNVISGISVVLYEPLPNRVQTGRKFRETVRDFYLGTLSR